MRALGFILLATITSQIALAAEPLLIQTNETPSKILPSRNFEFFNTKQEMYAKDWRTFAWSDAKSTGFQTKEDIHHHWIKFSVTNATSTDHSSILYHASNLTLEIMNVFVQQGENLIELGKSGANLPVQERSVKQRLIGVPLKIPAGQTVDLVVYSFTTRPFKPDFAITSEDDFNDYIQSRNLLNGFCMGILFIVCMIASVFAFRLKDRSYGWFALMALSMIALLNVSFGYRDASSLLRLIPFTSSEIGKFVRPLVTIMVLSHTAVFLSLRAVSPNLYVWFQATMVSLGTLIFLSFTPQVSNFAVSGADRLIFLGMILMVIASFKAWRQKIPQAGYFLLATTSLILSVIPWLIVQVFTLSVPRFAIDFVPIGQATQMCFLTLGLMSKVRSIDEARTKAEIEAGKNEELKSLVRALSHDLSNPISVVFAYAQKGISKCYDHKIPEVSQYFEKILKSAENQLSIIEHIKAMRAIQDGKFKVELSKVSLLTVMKQVEASFEVPLQDKKLKLAYDAKSIEDLHVLAEPLSLHHNVISNLISNAIKFSHPGSSIEILVSASDDRISITVADHGIGIPKEMIVNLFRADKQTSRPGTSGERGTGYGMPLVQSYVQKFGGDVSVQSVTEAESPERQGTRVTISLKKAA
jgi:signal transduction histidine kinase